MNRSTSDRSIDKKETRIGDERFGCVESDNKHASLRARAQVSTRSSSMKFHRPNFYQTIRGSSRSSNLPPFVPSREIQFARRTGPRISFTMGTSLPACTRARLPDVQPYNYITIISVTALHCFREPLSFRLFRVCFQIFRAYSQRLRFSNIGTFRDSLIREDPAGQLGMLLQFEQLDLKKKRFGKKFH